MIVVCLFLGQIVFSSTHSIHQLSLDPLQASVQQAPMYVMSNTFGAAVPADIQYYQQQGVSSQLPLLGSQCVDNITCSALPNTYCGSNHTCRCMNNFMEDPAYPGTCKLAPGYNEHCSPGDTECREPFVCNASNMCDCRPGFLQEYFQCVKDCPSGMVPVNDDCMPGRQLEEKCEKNEQCMQSHSQCLNNKCHCIPGTNQLNGNCYPVNQCPLGEPAKDKQGKVKTCTTDDEQICAKDFYCLHAEMGSPYGFCCPKIKMNCPIGQPLPGHNCTNCPWETHHCFSYVVGSYTEAMCCPNACPSGHPIQKDGKCYAKVAYQGHCMIDEQCYNVLGATCRKEKDGKKKCLCPEGNFKNFYGRCIKEAGLGEECTTNEECRQGTNSLCSSGVCTCFNGYQPEPSKAGAAAQRCIAEPSCPTALGLKLMESYTECTEDGTNCKENEFCRRWWNEVNITYSLCCPKARFSDYEAMCKPFRMKLMTVPRKTEPVRCDITSVAQLYRSQDAVNSSSVQCPSGASCLFDPYSVDKGICCKPDDATPFRASNPSMGVQKQPSGIKPSDDAQASAALPSSAQSSATKSSATKQSGVPLSSATKESSNEQSRTTKLPISVEVPSATKATTAQAKKTTTTTTVITTMTESPNAPENSEEDEIWRPSNISQIFAQNTPSPASISQLPKSTPQLPMSPSQLPTSPIQLPTSPPQFPTSPPHLSTSTTNRVSAVINQSETPVPLPGPNIKVPPVRIRGFKSQQG